MADVVSIQLRFGVDTVLGLYQDTLSFTEEEWASRDQKVIDARKQELADVWVTFRSAQIAEEEALRTRDGKLAKIAELADQIATLAATKATLEDQVATMPAIVVLP